jgi:MoCo/4Fe-4S cofactor protein with predicted Tat translocation signal
MPPLDRRNTGPAYWRSLNELADTPEFRAMVEREFPAGAMELLGTGPQSPSANPATRRQFLKLMGASFGLAGLTACRWPKENIVPYARRPENRTPGIPEQYATAMEIGGVAQGLLVTSYDGRPIKIEGNPLHPMNRGATDVYAQASVLELYDPDRSRVIVRQADGHRFTHSWDDFTAFARPHFAELKKRSGEGLCVLSEATSSPTVIDMRARLLKAFPRAKWYEYEPISRDNELAGAKLAFGKPYRTHLHLDKAKVIVCLDADILGAHPAAIKYARDFADSRTADPLKNGMSRLYAVESTYSITGSMADRRFPVRTSDIPAFAWQLAKELFVTRHVAAGRGSEMTVAQIKEIPERPEWTSHIKAVADDLTRHQGLGLVVAGPSLPPDVHALCHAINAVFGASGGVAHYTLEPEADGLLDREAITALSGDMAAGGVNTLLLLGGNPVFDAPVDAVFTHGLTRVPTSIHLSVYLNETSQQCTWHLPRSHYLEAWGDSLAYDGTVCVAQPLIDPLYDGKSTIELLSTLLDPLPRSGHDIVRDTIRRLRPDRQQDEAWQQIAHDGLLAESAFSPADDLPPNAYRLRGAFAAMRQRLQTKESRSDFELVFRQDYRIYDGRFANNGWLQELPDPMTRLTWDNAAIISPADAKKLGVTKIGEMIRIESSGRAIEMPAFILAGQASGSITLPVGSGRRQAGRVAEGAGFNVYGLRPAGDVVTGAQVSRTGREYWLVGVEDFHHIDLVGVRAKHERAAELVQEATLAEYRANPEIIRERTHEKPPGPLWQPPHEYLEHKWGMAIDLTRCTGCSACVVACQAENNIPVVGKDQVWRGRIMHWIRADRYFRGEPEGPSVAHQIVACMHCENAPCEEVCPVGATMHDAEGLNVQVYNRCVGTRYCSNNCPYKVRRFNWYHYQLDPPQTFKMQFNPEVTVRSRGVMEKCTYCVQRIHAVRLKARLEERLIRDGEIVPACAQACPTRAIVFGDLNDKDSEVSKLHASNRAYGMLAELNVKPRTVYLAKLTNPGDTENAE